MATLVCFLRFGHSEFDSSLCPTRPLRKTLPYLLCVANAKEDQIYAVSKLVRVTTLLHARLADAPKPQTQSTALEIGPLNALLFYVPKLCSSIATTLCCIFRSGRSS